MQAVHGRENKYEEQQKQEKQRSYLLTRNPTLWKKEQLGFRDSIASSALKSYFTNKKTWQITSNVTSLSRIILTFHLAFTRTTSTGPKHRKPCCFDSTFFKEPQGAKSRVVCFSGWAIFHLRENDLKKVNFYSWVIFHYDCWNIFYDYVEDQTFIIIENQHLLMMTLLIHRRKFK